MNEMDAYRGRRLFANPLLVLAACAVALALEGHRRAGQLMVEDLCTRVLPETTRLAGRPVKG